jgi:transposase
LKTKIEERPVNISTIAHCFDLEVQTLNVWYKNQLSDYRKAKAEGRFMGQKAELIDIETGEIKKELAIYIFERKNIGSTMNLDEKMLGKTYYTILSNQETGKIAYLIGSMKPELISNGLQKLGKENLDKITRINNDMSPTMKKICKENFINAKIIVDKFHVIKHVLDALNTVRLDLKKNIKDFNQANIKNPNGWTDIECLEKCKYLLYSSKDKISEENKEVLKMILGRFPILKEAYDYSQKIRDWYDKKHIRDHIWAIKQTMEIWMIELETTKLKAFKVILKMFNKHENDICRYFERGSTNAKAENLNARLQRFLTNNFGIKDKDFFFFRASIYFA